MFTVGLVAFAFVSMGLCQQMQQPNTGLPSQYLPSAMSQGYFQGPSAAVQQTQNKFGDIENQSDKLLSSNMEVPQQQSQSYQDAQSYPSAFDNTGVQYSVNVPNSYRDVQDSQQYYEPATQQAAEPQLITKESYSAALPAVVPATTPAPVQPDYKQMFTALTDTQQDFSAANAAQAQQEYNHHQEYIHHQEYRRQHLAYVTKAQEEYKQQIAALEQAQQEYKQQFAALEQAQREYKQQFTALSQAQHELNQQFDGPVKAQQELKEQSAVLAQVQHEYNQQYSALSQAQKEYKQHYAALNEAQQELNHQFAAPIKAQQELKQQSAVLAQAQHEYNQQFSALVQAQKEYKQQFADLAQAQLEFKQQFAALIQAQKDLKQHLAASAQISYGHKQRFNAPAQQVYKQQYAVPDQGRQDYKQRFGGPAPRYQYIQKSTTASATGPVNYSNAASAATAQPKSLQYATIPQQYYTVPTGQVVVTEQPRIQQSATNQSSTGAVVSTTPTPLRESVVYKSEQTPTLRQQPKVANSNLRVIA
ncbi:hypothetical protein ACI65C_012476 [Semiaphis heraclei]